MNRIFASLFLFSASFVLAPLTALAAPITVPSDLTPGDQYRLAFLSSTARDATSSNIADYNAFVTTVANSVPELAALGTTWKAIGSTATVAARDNTGTNPSSIGVPIYLLDDTRIADDNADLWDGNIQVDFGVDENGTFFGSSFLVWTGTVSNGANLSQYYLGADTPVLGVGYATTFNWITASVGQPSTFTHRMYAMSDVLTVATPEPSTMVLACLAAAGLALASLHRRRHGKT